MTGGARAGGRKARQESSLFRGSLRRQRTAARRLVVKRNATGLCSALILFPFSDSTVVLLLLCSLSKFYAVGPEKIVLAVS